MSAPQNIVFMLLDFRLRDFLNTWTKEFLYLM